MQDFAYSFLATALIVDSDRSSISNSSPALLTGPKIASTHASHARCRCATGATCMDIVMETLSYTGEHGDATECAQRRNNGEG